MDLDPWPRVSNVTLRNSLQTAEELADVARQVTDPPLHRLLLAASCRVLDGALAAAMGATPARPHPHSQRGAPT